MKTIKPTLKGLTRLQQDVMAVTPKDCPICGVECCNRAECADLWQDGYARCPGCGKLYERHGDGPRECNDCTEPPIPRGSVEWHRRRRQAMEDNE